MRILLLQNVDECLAGGSSWCTSSRVPPPPQRPLCHGGHQHCQVFLRSFYRVQLPPQTQLAGRRPHDWETFEASHDRDHLHQLCRPAHSRREKRCASGPTVCGVFSIQYLQYSVFSSGSPVCGGPPVFSSKLIKSEGGTGWSNSADQRRDVKQILLACGSIPKDDGGKRIPSKRVGWSEGLLLSVKHRHKQNVTGRHSLYPKIAN